MVGGVRTRHQRGANLLTTARCQVAAQQNVPRGGGARTDDHRCGHTHSLDHTCALLPVVDRNPDRPGLKASEVQLGVLSTVSGGSSSAFIARTNVSGMIRHRSRFARDNFSVSVAYARGNRGNPYGGVGRRKLATCASRLTPVRSADRTLARRARGNSLWGMTTIVYDNTTTTWAPSKLDPYRKSVVKSLSVGTHASSPTFSLPTGKPGGAPEKGG